MNAYAMDLGNDRLANPKEDLTTALMHAEVDGERLTSAEFGSFFILLVVAGNETTRNAMSHGMKALTDFPDQRTLWWDDFGGVAHAVGGDRAWASPVDPLPSHGHGRHGDRGAPHRRGDKVVLWYNSANRDEAKFADPYVFDVRRDNPQVGYGAGGPHFCLGRTWPGVSSP